MTELNQLRSQIDRADSTYYRPGLKPLMTDLQYDQLKARLRQLAPDDERLARVGVPYAARELGSKVRHRIPMGSLDNTDQGILGLEPWFERLVARLSAGEPVGTVASLKIDGSSVVADYEDSRLVRVTSRGNGEVGEDITANAVLFRGLPSLLPVPGLTLSVRGEAILYRSEFQRLNAGKTPDEITNPRNVGAGIIGRDSGEGCDLIQFVAFNAAGVGMVEQSVADRYAFLSHTLGLTVAPWALCHTLEDVVDFYNDALARRATLAYEIDGVVVELNRLEHQNRFVTADPKTRLRPKYARAIKFPSYTAQTRIVGCAVTVGHTGSIVPTLDLEPVRMGTGSTVDSVHMTNFDRVGNLGLAVGDLVQVSLAGDIIPYLDRVVTPGTGRKIVEPTACPSCSAVLTRRGKNLYCTNLTCPGVEIGKIAAYIGGSKKGVGILDIGDEMIAALYHGGLVRDPADLYTLTEARLAEVRMSSGGRIGLSRARKIVANIAAKRVLPLHLFLGSLGVELLGRRRVTILAEAAGGQLDRLEDWLDDDKLSSIQLAGLGETMREAIRGGLNRVRPLVVKFLTNGVVVEPVARQAAPADGALPLAGVSFCFTGTRECLERVEALGGLVHSDVRKGTDFLVQKGDKSTSKAQKAEKLGTVVITLDQLRAALEAPHTLRALRAS